MEQIRNVNVFLGQKLISTPPIPEVQIQIRGQEKNDTFFIDRKEKKKKGRRGKEGKKRGKGGRKKEGKRKEAKKEWKCVFRLKK